MLFKTACGFDDTWDELIGVYADEMHAKKVAHRLEGMHIAQYAQSPEPNGHTLRWAKHSYQKGESSVFAIKIKEMNMNMKKTNERRFCQWCGTPF